MSCLYGHNSQVPQLKRVPLNPTFGNNFFLHIKKKSIFKFHPSETQPARKSFETWPPKFSCKLANTDPQSAILNFTPLLTRTQKFQHWSNRLRRRRRLGSPARQAPRLRVHRPGADRGARQAGQGAVPERKRHHWLQRQRRHN